MALWKGLAIGVVAYGGLALAAAIFPQFSLTAAVFTGGLAIVGVVSITLGWHFSNWWARVIGVNAYTSLFLAITVRSWAYLLLSEWAWLGILLPFYILAWSMPALMPKLSQLMFREHFAPQTRWGKVWGKAFLVIGPSLTGISATFGYHAARRGAIDLVFLIVAVMGTVVTMLLSQVVAQQLWPDRPWASKKAEPEGGGSL